MNLKTSCGLMCIILFLISCATTVSKKPATRYAPKETKKTGVVAYNPSGLKDIVDLRKQDAYKKIYTLCGSSNEYTITLEETKKLENFDSESIATLGASKLTYLYYQCNK